MNTPRRFVPTLTDVVRPEELVQNTHAPQEPESPNDVPAPVASQPVELVSTQHQGRGVGAVDVQALVATVCDTVNRSLDDRLRTTVMQQVQAQQLLLIQSVRAELAPLVQNLVQDAVRDILKAELQQQAVKFD